MKGAHGQASYLSFQQAAAKLCDWSSRLWVRPGWVRHRDVKIFAEGVDTVDDIHSVRRKREELPARPRLIDVVSKSEPSHDQVDPFW